MVCNYFFNDAYNDELPKKNLLFNKAQIKKKLAAGTHTDEDEAFLLQIEDTLQCDKATLILKYDVNYLSNFIAASISQEKEAIIYIFFDGSVREFIGDNYTSHHKYDIDRLEPHICLSLTNYLKEFINDEELSTLFMPQILNDEEQKVLLEMRKKNIKQITIIFNKETTPRIESSTTGVLTEKQTKAIKEIVGLKNYEQIILDTMDEKSISFKRTRKRI
ncbi:MAG: hypothetical protein IPI54_12130 [Chitinophagaceae bacterium]|nr:hypothetical protein [Chitinophagaceae bacterium]